jgi:hypothetical protein
LPNTFIKPNQVYQVRSPNQLWFAKARTVHRLSTKVT